MPQPSIPAVSTARSSPSHRASQPRVRRIRTEASTSRRRGQLRSTTCPLASSVAARMGSTLFFAPWIRHLARQRAAAPQQQKLAHIRSPPNPEWFAVPSYGTAGSAGYLQISSTV